MKNRKLFFRSILLPVVILIPLLWLMTGCLYLPFFEHRIDNGPNIRAMVGAVHSGRPIQPGAITSEHVITLLGEAPWRSADGSALGYEAHTSVSTWVYPLCFFGAEPADAKVYVVRLVFNKDGTLDHYDWADESEYEPPSLLLRYSGQPPDGPTGTVIEKLNKTGPVLLPNPRSSERYRIIYENEHGQVERQQMFKSP